MHDIATEDKEMRKDAHAYLRQCVAECLPLLDKSIKLGYPALADAGQIERYYARKHARGEYGTYWPLHVTGKPQFGAMRAMRKRK